MSDALPVHSSLGASGMERWMHCPGSVALIKLYTLPESDEPDYRADGSRAHEAAAHCLSEGLDAWQIIGEPFYDGRPVTEEMAGAIQTYLDECRLYMVDGWKWWVEVRVSHPDHEWFYGTVDFYAISPDGATLIVRDFKYGQGVVVEVENNPQVLYYAYGVLVAHPDPVLADIGIVQPRAFHMGGPIRTWEVSSDDVLAWANDVMYPAALRVEMDNDLVVGSHCRFCPAKLICPVLTGLFGAAMKANPEHIPNLSDEALGRDYVQLEGLAFYVKAMRLETQRRLALGHDIPNTKLVWMKSNRVFRPGGAEHFIEKYGDEVYVPRVFKTPAQMEKIAEPGVKADVKKWAYTPQVGLTVALSSDPRPAIIPKTLSEEFAGFIDKAQSDD